VVRVTVASHTIPSCFIDSGNTATTTKAGNHTVDCVGLTPTGVQRHETKSQTRLISRPDRERQPTDGGGPLSRYAYTKMWRGVGGTYDVVRCDLFSSPTSPSHRSLRRSGGGNPPHHFGSPALTGSGVVRPPRANAPRIYFHFTDKNLYAGSNDVEFIGQALW
jgi:hypothetical protein